MFFAKDNEPNQDPAAQGGGGGFFGGLGDKVKEAGSFFQSLEPENAEALLVAGLQLMDGKSAGQAGMAGLGARNSSIGRQEQQQQRTLANEFRTKQLGVAEGNLAVSQQNAKSNAQRIAQEALNANKPKRDPFDARIDSMVEQGLISAEAGNSLKLQDVASEASRSSKVTTHDGDLTKANITSRNDELSRITNTGNLVGDLLSSVKGASPFDFGAVGNIRETLGGYASQANLGGLAEVISPDGKMRQEARTVGLMAATSIINESRATGEERAQVVEIISVLSNDGSQEKAIKGLETIKKISDNIRNRVQGEIDSNSAGGSGKTFDAEALYQGLLKDSK